MRTIANFADLRQYGIILLTAESDATAIRILCDLTRHGVEVFCTAFGLTIPERGKEAVCLNTPWNSATDGSPHVASVLIPHWETGTFQHLAIFALGLSGAEEIWVTEQGGVIGFFAGDTETLEKEFEDTYQRIYKIVRRIKGWVNVDNPVQRGDRNVHPPCGLTPIRRYIIPAWPCRPNEIPRPD